MAFYDEFDDDVATEYSKAKAWYATRSVYVGTAIGFGLGPLVTWVF